MNRLIHRLNPKTNSFDGIGVASSTVNIITATDIAAALSFSQMPAISHDLIRAKCLNENDDSVIESIAIALLAVVYPDDIHTVELKNCAIVAIIEFCKVPADYKTSGRKRAVLLGISETTYRRLNLVSIIDRFLMQLEDYYAVGRAKLGRQFASLRDA